MDETTTNAETDGQAGSKLAFLPLIICTLGILVVPYLIAIFVPAAAAGWTVIGVFAVLTLGSGVFFGALTAPTWWFPLIIGVVFLVAKALYFQEGTFLYAVLFALLSGFGTLITGHGKLDLDDEEESGSSETPKGEVKHGNLEA